MSENLWPAMAVNHSVAFDLPASGVAHCPIVEAAEPAKLGPIADTREDNSQAARAGGVMSKAEVPADALARRDRLAFVQTDGLSTYAVYPAIGKRRLIRPGEPEERVRLEQYNRLIENYGYPPELIDIEFPVLIREDEQPRYADIVVFTDREQKRPYIVVEVKRPKREDGLKQGQRYATILRAVYVLWSNGSQRAFSVIVNRYPEDAIAITDIPSYNGAPRPTVLELESFADDRKISDAFRKCHNLIRNLSHLKPDDAFTEFLKVLLVKLQDEARGGEYEFQVFGKGSPPTPEPENETAQRIRQIFKAAVEEDSEVSSVFQQGDDIALTNDCIAQIVKELQHYSFATTSVDQKGRAFETFISGDMRQEFKEFMTPRAVVETMVSMADRMLQQPYLIHAAVRRRFLSSR
jgi:hypothetical protein